MAGPNAQIVRDALDAWRERDFARLEDLIHPRAELRPLRAQLERTEYVGAQGARQVAQDLERDWEDLEIDVDEIHEEGQTVAVLGRLTARGRASGASIDMRIGWHWIVRDGQITYGAAHSEPEEALQQAELSGVTHENISAVRRHYEAFNDGDVDRIAATLHPEIEIFGGDERAAGARERYRGIAEAREFFGEIKELVADNWVETLMLEATPQRVVASIRLHGTLRGTENPGALPAVHFFTIREGLIARIETYRPDWRALA